MRVRYSQSPTSVVIAVALTLVLVAPAVLSAAPAGSTVETKKAEKAAAVAALNDSRAEIAAQVAAYIKLGREIERTQAEVVRVESELTVFDATLAAKEDAFKQRAIQLYRSDRASMLTVLLESGSLRQFWARAHYLVMINQRDKALMQELRLARSENLWLHNNLAEKADKLARLQEDADAEREKIEARVETLEAQAVKLDQDIAELMKPTGIYEGSTETGAFDRNTVISDAQFRDYDSMTAADIQAFLNRQPGTLKSYRAVDYNGTMKSAAEMIADAAVGWKVNPKVILVKLQKEQSLLADKTPTQEAYDWALGCGKADSRTFYEYKGFGKQIWWGASKLDKNAGPWKPGITMKIDQTTIHPTNESTYSLYKYTPHFKGTMSFWLIYWRYFGDPLAADVEA